MTTALTLVVKVLDQCKQGRCFPQAENVWPHDELVKVLHLSGLRGPWPTVGGHERLVQMLLDHLNVQIPPVYALCTDQALVLDSTTVHVRQSTLQIGPYAKLHPLPTPLPSCEQIWQLFVQRHHHAATTTDQLAPSPAVLEKQMQILALEKEVARLKTQLQGSEVGQLRLAVDEGHRVIKALEAKLQAERRQLLTLREKNLTLAREAQMTEARTLELRDQLQHVRNRLGVRTLSPEGLERALEEVARLKQQLGAV